MCISLNSHNKQDVAIVNAAIPNWTDCVLKHELGATFGY